MIDAPPRAWHKKDKKMYPVDALYWHGGEFDSIWIVDKESLVVDDRRCNPDEVILLLPTGLKDKNGKMIYEGDVVNYDALKCEIIWEKDVARFAIASPVNDERFPGYLCLSNAIPWENLEIVGNKFENPELLEEKA